MALRTAGGDPVGGGGGAVPADLADAAQGDDDPGVGEALEAVQQVDVGDLLEQLHLGVTGHLPDAGGGELHVEVASVAAAEVMQALDEQRRDLQLPGLGMQVDVQRRSEGAARHPEGEVGAHVGHEVAADELVRVVAAGAVQGVERHAGVLDRAQPEEDQPVGGHVQITAAGADAGDPVAGHVQGDDVGVVQHHEPLADVVG